MDRQPNAREASFVEAMMEKLERAEAQGDTLAAGEGYMRRILFLSALALIVSSQPSHAILINEFLRRTPIEQQAYAAGAANMLAFTEGLDNNRAARMNCITGWYRSSGADQLFATLKLSPSAFKSRYGFDRDGTQGHVEFVLTILANEACPK
ncbi:MAG: hypothetical protein HYU37_09940 [Acidobacteria bacterium]|nr:hypothetical protein [Acidobacteriota bacterium]